MSVIPLKLYALLATLAAPVLRRHLRRRAEAGREVPKRLGERRGYEQSRRPPGRLIWLHAASIGETMSVLPVIGHLLAEPDVTVLITTGTRTSAELLSRRIPELFPPGRVQHRFVPLDVPRWTRRFLAHWHPDVAAFVESEIWPNLMRAAHRAAIPMMIVNGRMSAASARRWRRAPGVIGHLLRLFAVVEAQTEADAQRFAALGAKAASSPGNLKFAAADLPVDEVELRRLEGHLAGCQVWLAASTHPGEEAIAATVHAALLATHPHLVTLIVPRHPERGAGIAADIAAAHPGVTVARRGSRQDPTPGGIYVADTIGELGLFYRLAPIVFVGRSLAVGGGQNPIEPARLGCAVAVGPQFANFVEAVDVLRQAGALDVVADAGALQEWIAALLVDSQRRAAMGEAGIAASAKVAGLPAQTAATLLGLIRRP